MRRAGGITRKALRIGADFGLPVALYYGLRLGGVSVYLSLLAGALVSAVSALVPLARNRRLDGVSGFMTVMMLGSVGVSLVSGSTRFLLAREALLTGVTGIWFIASIWTGRPLAYQFSRPLLEGRLHWPDSWETIWETAPRFRRMWRISSVMFGIGTLLDAVARVVMAYTLRPDIVPGLATALYLVTSAVLIACSTVYYVVSGVYNPHSALYEPGPRPLAGAPDRSA
jgi:hypothetical protein